MRRFLQRLRTALARPAAVFVYHASYARTVSGVPIDPARADEILAFLLDRGLISRRDVSQPIPASLENLLRVHTAAYLETLPDPATLTAIFGSPVRPDEIQGIIDLQRLSVGGTIQATRLALGGGGPVAVNLKGGLHHAAPARGMGFCLFNDIAVAIRRLRARGFAEPVLVVDLDLHDGNGTRAAFATDASVHTFSIHNRTWDDAPAVAATSLALGEGVTDDAYLTALRDTLPPVVRAHRPGLVLYVAGCDPAADDRLGDWRITPVGMLERDRFVVQQVRGANGRRIPLVILPGGGYGPNAWRYSARFFGWLVSGRVIEPPGDIELALDRFHPVAREFAATTASPREAPDATAEWSLSESDVTAPTQGGASERVLGHYSRHVLELLLERLGFFKRLRDLGFRHPVLD
ncbi:MAG TPA: histone deacetylase, partial [Gemmatimonadales bacterium]|nr:histone deacetylase [Gemmatimonadales bacterium]